MGSYCLMTTVSVCDGEKVVEMDLGGGCTTS